MQDIQAKPQAIQAVTSCSGDSYPMGYSGQAVTPPDLAWPVESTGTADQGYVLAGFRIPTLHICGMASRVHTVI